MALDPRARLGPYEIVSLVGAGGMGEIYKATDTRLNRTVAIKVLTSTLAVDPGLCERFDREARIVSRVDHPHICPLYDIGTHEGTTYLVMPYLDGETLAARLQRGPLALDEALACAIEILDALNAAHHAGITHRDLKPANVMLTKSGRQAPRLRGRQTAVPGCPRRDPGCANQHAANAADEGGNLCRHDPLREPGAARGPGVDSLQAMVWPGAVTAAEAYVAIEDRIAAPEKVAFSGPWALFRLADDLALPQAPARQDTAAVPAAFRMSTRNHSAQFMPETPGSNPFVSREWRQFRCNSTPTR